jgi:hypothetical protein
MDNTLGDTPGRDVPVRFYRLIQQQTRPPGRSNSLAVLACAVFIIAAVLLVLSLELGADIESLLFGVFAVAVVNLVLAVFWIAGPRRES